MNAQSPLPTIPQAQREAILTVPRDPATHARLLASLPFATALDVAPPAPPLPTMNLDATSKAAARFPRSEPKASGEAHKARARETTDPRNPTLPHSEPTASGEAHKARARETTELRNPTLPHSEPTASGDAHQTRELPRALAWNAERCKHLDESAAFLAAQDADVLLLSELDWGMARSGQLHTARELAARLGFAYAYGVEFLELDLGGARERAAFAGQRNEVGYHGNAILSRLPLARPQLVRLETRGDWFDGARGEARVGGRCAVLAQLPVAGRTTTFVAPHLESHGSAANRASEMRVLLDAIDAYDRDAPVVIGGDLNAFSLGLAEIGDPARVAAALRVDPQRWSHPVPHEPLFALAEARGFDWSRCNELGVATLRHATESGSSRGAMKLDWFLCRGIATSAPRVVDALGPTSGAMLSDHEAIAVTLGV